MPCGFLIPGKVWHLKKFIYGLKQSSRNYYLHMKEKLSKLGFHASEADLYLFVSTNIICLLYVDDSIFVYQHQSHMDDLIKRMNIEGMLFHKQEDMAGFLGVHIDRTLSDRIVLTQSGLIERIIEALNIRHLPSVSTPADKFLPIDTDGDPPQGMYNYPSVVVILNYLIGHTRCDLGLAASQVARYVHCPKRSHELDLERIGRYRKGTADKGLILHPKDFQNSFAINVYVDAAFACGWSEELGTNPDSVKSRTGYIIEIMCCPVIWVAKLQTSIATSTMESEYTALSMALQAAIPLLAIVESVVNGLQYKSRRILSFQATVHKDNQGALILATLEPGRHTPRSKFYAIKLHWFRSWLNPKSIVIIFCPTKEQKADFLTKPLTKDVFQSNRKLSMGW